MKRALELGANFWNAGEFYGPPEANSLQLLAHYFTVYPEDASRVVLSIKGGVISHKVDCRPSVIRESIDNCLRILDNKVFIDIYEAGRVDPSVPYEQTIEVIAEYVKAGKIGGIGVSECNARTIRRIHAVHPIAAAEIELSLFTTDPLHNGISDVCAELGIPLLAYSPLGMGWLTGQFRRVEDLPKDDYRRSYPRFQPDVFHLNLQLVKGLEDIARRKGVTLPQVAIAWVRGLNSVPGMPVVVPIPGCTTVARVEENLAPILLTEDEKKKIGELLREIPVHGERYGGYAAQLMNL
jgi:pyridoxine 4-dehydrogenase